MLLVAIQPTRAPLFARMARAITIGCFVVHLVNLRPAQVRDTARQFDTIRVLRRVQLGRAHINSLRDCAVL